MSEPTVPTRESMEEDYWKHCSRVKLESDAFALLAEVERLRKESHDRGLKAGDMADEIARLRERMAELEQEEKRYQAWLKTCYSEGKLTLYPQEWNSWMLVEWREQLSNCPVCRPKAEENLSATIFGGSKPHDPFPHCDACKIALGFLKNHGATDE